MTQANTQIARVRYNLEFSGYEAMVFVKDEDGVFSYPGFVSAPLDADYAFIMRRLQAKALESHASAKPGLRSRLNRAAPAAQVRGGSRLAA